MTQRPRLSTGWIALGIALIMAALAATALAQEAPPTTPPPVIVVTAIAKADGGVAIMVENVGIPPATISRYLTVEVQTETGWQAVPDHDVLLDLRTTCGGPELLPPETPCFDLFPEVPITPPEWSGDFGEAQCGCDECAPAPPGTYRVVVTSCGGSEHYVSEAFSLPGEGDQVVLESARETLTASPLTADVCLPVTARECGCVYSCGMGWEVGPGTYLVRHSFWPGMVLRARLEPLCFTPEGCFDVLAAEIVCDMICSPVPPDTTCHFADVGGTRTCVGRPE